MQVNPYLHYNGNCETAFKFYEKAVGARIEVLMTHEAPHRRCRRRRNGKRRSCTAAISFDGEVLMASDSPPGHFHQPQGFSVTLTVDDPADAEKKFKALSEGGTVNMAFTPTFFAKGFGMCVDQFGIPWMVISPMEIITRVPGASGILVPRKPASDGGSVTAVAAHHAARAGVALRPTHSVSPAHRIDRRQLPPAQQQHARGQPAAAADPAAHR